MGRPFPTDREEKRQVLLEAVERVRDTLRAGADDAEANATLPPATVQALDDAGLLALKLPAVLGGAEADLVTQLEVLEAVTYIDTSAGWCTLIGAAAIASLGAFLGDEAMAQIFGDGQVPRAAGAFMPSGQAVPVAGGYRVSGRWAFASGIRHAQWVSATARVVGESAAAPALRAW
jgi:indole-3-acetate monooxygenase